MTIKLKHPESKTTIEVANEAAAGVYRDQGWSESGKAADLTPQLLTEGK